ncbi:MAG TPA: efflux RND transporter periplasmic adaptor subunit [Chitinophaga sp.]|uniref:efflux RND transporter periplasmic adaptor subunit n=1 Tax=Chitinophaga sp. TaxID=1869181 RepID=UPI002C8F7AD9|nr:efflux RND transporter periplasmic adaptor subunit [Chitinophaga sp.]HVI45625.1 efflux RND transporter periplasmic adaptor subunit [Chitinophaga sp.]
MKMYMLACCAILTAASCNRAESVKEETAQFELRGDTILIPEGSPLKARIRTYTVEDKPYRLQLLTAGVVKAIPNNYAEIAPPFSGRVVKSYMSLGETVSPGAPLFSISSPDFFAAQKAWFQAKQLWQQAVTAQQRQRDLMQHGVGAGRDLEEATTNVAVQLKEMENAAAALKVFNINPQQQVLGEPLIIRSPIHGEVIENKLVNGQFLKADGGSVAIVAQLSQVWIAGQVKEKDLRFINEGDEVKMEVPAMPDTVLKGKVFHVSRIVNEDTRAVDVLMICDNPAHCLKPGMYANVKFMDPPVSVITVPAKALLQESNSGYVFVQTGANTYVRRKVETGDTDSSTIIIKSGLKPGEKIIGEGAFYLSAAK